MGRVCLGWVNLGWLCRFTRFTLTKERQPLHTMNDEYFRQTWMCVPKSIFTTSSASELCITLFNISYEIQVELLKFLSVVVASNAYRKFNVKK